MPHIEQITLVDGIRQWRYATKGWKWSEDFGCYIQKDGVSGPPKAFCLGERYVHWDYGIDSCGLLRGSTVANWHGASFGYDLHAAIEWVKQAEHPECEYHIWGK